MVVTINYIKRLHNSVNGNPRYMLDTNKGVFRTQPDAGYSYAIHKGYEGKQALINLDSKQRISSIDLMTV